MVTITKRLLALAVMVIMVLSLAVGMAGCNTFGLEKYKEKAKSEIDSYAQANYREETWTAIQNVVANNKRSIDVAKSKSQVDKVVTATKQAIDKVEAERIKPMYGAEEYTEGSGTENAPYIISTKGHLIYFSNQINSGENTSAYFALGADIDLENMEWTPIGILTAYYNGGNCFYGVFDGKGYEVSNFCITTRQKNTRAENIGLFGYNAGTIQNLGVVDFDIDISWSYEFGYIWSVSAGGLAGRNLGNIANCFVIGNIDLEYSGRSTSVSTSPSHVNAGGLVGSGSYGSSNGIITDCYAVVDVSAKCSDEPGGSVYAAGLVAGGNAKNCFATGDVSVDGISLYYTQGGASNLGAIELLNCYGYEGQEINSSSLFGPSVDYCSADELNDSGFYTDKLGWNADDWDLENLEFAGGKYLNGNYPKLIKK